MQREDFIAGCLQGDDSKRSPEINKKAGLNSANTDSINFPFRAEIKQLRCSALKNEF
jgi:hypothetical protein